jgi:hypothetical protein
MKHTIAILLLSLLPLGCASYISPIDKAIITAGCDRTLQLAEKVENDANSSTDARDIMRMYAERAKYLKNWANGEGFPLGAQDFVK